MHLPLRILPVLGVTLAVGVAACGSSSSSSSSTPSSSSSSGGSGSGGSGTAVTIKGFKYMPATITVKAGSKVTWTNQDPDQHTATAEKGPSFDTGTLKQGQSKTVSFTKPGTYPYTCSFHAFMHGTVVVK